MALAPLSPTAVDAATLITKLIDDGGPVFKVYWVVVCKPWF